LASLPGGRLRRLIASPRVARDATLHIRLGLDHQWRSWSNRLEVQGVSRKDDLSSVRNEIEPPGYGLVNLRVGYKAQKLKVEAGIENVFDRLYALPLGGA
jgi:iron complex outermembrane receptor protein